MKNIGYEEEMVAIVKRELISVGIYGEKYTTKIQITKRMTCERNISYVKIWYP
jgi:hypothetical protein